MNNGRKIKTCLKINPWFLPLNAYNKSYFVIIILASVISLLLSPVTATSQIVNDLRVNTDTMLSKPKYYPKVSSNQNGSAVVVWEISASNYNHIYAQIFDKNFTRIGDNIKVNGNYAFARKQDVAVRNDGSFGIAWSGYSNASPAGSRVFLNIYDNQGNIKSQEILINDTIKDVLPEIRIGTDTLNRFIVSFSYGQPGFGHRNIFFQIIDSNGVKIGNNVKVNQNYAYGKHSIGVQRDGGFVISWEGSMYQYNHYIYCQLYSGNGTPIGQNQRVNDIPFDTLYIQYLFPETAMDSIGNFEIGFFKPYQSIYTQRFDKNGVKIGANNYVGSYETVFIASDSEGNKIFLLSAGSMDNIRYNKNGLQIGNFYPASNLLPGIDKIGGDVSFANKNYINVWTDYRHGYHPQIYMNVRSFLNPDSVVAIHNISTEIPGKYSLDQNYPNPFNPTTKINFAIPKKGFVAVNVYDITGREVQTLVNEVKPAGYYTVDFNGTNLASGIYFYRIESGDFASVKKMVLVK